MALKYKPTTAKFKGRTKTYYIYYESLDRVRGGKLKWKPHVKRVYVSGDLIEWEVGTFTNRYGRRVHGVKIVYENPRESYTAQRGSTKYKVKRTKVTVTKIVKLPEDARNVRIYTRRRDVEPTVYDTVL